MSDYAKQRVQITLLSPLGLARWNCLSLSLGGMIWVFIGCFSLIGWLVLGDLQLLLLLALLVIIPLALPLVAFSSNNRLFERAFFLALFLQPFATFTGAVSLMLGIGPLGGALAIVWLLYTGLLALVGLLRFFQVKRRSLSDMCLTAALLYLPIGGAWMALARLGLQPLGFGVHTDLLTAIHFHFIALAALIITGLTGQAIWGMRRGMAWQIYRVLASCMLVNPLLVAAGITIAQVSGTHFLETAGACLLAFCLILIALFNLRFIVPTTRHLFARGLLLMSSTAVVWTMLAAGAYALGNATGIWHITISQMILIHGWVNALVFGLCGLLGWRLRTQQERS